MLPQQGWRPRVGCGAGTPPGGLSFSSMSSTPECFGLCSNFEVIDFAKGRRDSVWGFQVTQVGVKYLLQRYRGPLEPVNEFFLLVQNGVGHLFDTFVSGCVLVILQVGVLSVDTADTGAGSYLWGMSWAPWSADQHPCPHPLNARNTPSRDNHRCPQTLPNVPRGAKSPVAENLASVKERATLCFFLVASWDLTWVGFAI